MYPYLVERPLVGDPAGVHCRHVDLVHLQLQAGGAGQHVEGRLGHVGVGVAVALGTEDLKTNIF